jgi:hypothetical protein
MNVPPPISGGDRYCCLCRARVPDSKFYTVYHRVGRCRGEFAMQTGLCDDCLPKFTGKGTGYTLDPSSVRPRRK